MLSSLVVPLPRQALYWALAAGVLSAGCSPATPPAKTEAIRPALVVPVRDAGANSFQLVGEIRAAQRAELAFAVGGRVQSSRRNRPQSRHAGECRARQS